MIFNFNPINRMFQKIYSTKHIYSGKVKQELRVTSYEAQIHELRVKIYELRIQIH